MLYVIYKKNLKFTKEVAIHKIPRVGKEITLLKFRDTGPKEIVAMVTRNPNLLLASEENVQIFMLATISRSNVKNVAKRRDITHAKKQQVKRTLNLK